MLYAVGGQQQNNVFDSTLCAVASDPDSSLLVPMGFGKQTGGRGFGIVMYGAPVKAF